MLLCDIGNTTANFLDDNSHFSIPVVELNPNRYDEKVYFICVNQALLPLFKTTPNWIDISTFIDKSSYYETMGVDRVVACEAIEHGVIVDAGSAITVDVVRDSVFEGGFIYPGVKAMQRCYADISPALDYSFNFELVLDKMPKNSQDALSYGFLKLLYSEVVSHGLPIFLTGGDAELLRHIFPEATVDRLLLFNGMKKIIDKVEIC
jgi:type III pantothenate kinase